MLVRSVTSHVTFHVTSGNQKLNCSVTRHVTYHVTTRNQKLIRSVTGHVTLHVTCALYPGSHSW